MEIKYAYASSDVADKINGGKACYYNEYEPNNYAIIAQDIQGVAKMIAEGVLLKESQITNWPWLGAIMAQAINIYQNKR